MATYFFTYSASAMKFQVVKDGKDTPHPWLWSIKAQAWPAPNTPPPVQPEHATGNSPWRGNQTEK